MSTFSDLYTKLRLLNYKRTIMKYLIEHTDGEFLQIAGTGTPRKTLLTDDKMAVPSEAFDGVISDLLKTTEQLDQEIKVILETNLMLSSTNGDTK